MRISFFAFFIVAFNVVHAQNTKLADIQTYSNYNLQPDTISWFKSKKAMAEKLQLADLMQNADSFHFRLWTYYQVLDLWTTDNRSYQSSITNFAEELKKKSNDITGKVFFNTIALDAVNTAEIVNKLNEFAITSIPSDHKIKSWPQNGLDGYEYCIEISTAKNYAFKTYWSPGFSKDSVPEAKKMQDFIDFLFSEIKMYSFYETLKLPANVNLKKYGISGMMIGVPSPYPPTNKSVLETLQ